MTSAVVAVLTFVTVAAVVAVSALVVVTACFPESSLGLMTGKLRFQPRLRVRQASSRSAELRRDLRESTALVWIWQTRLSVTPRTRPISAKVRLS